MKPRDILSFVAVALFLLDSSSAKSAEPLTTWQDSSETATLTVGQVPLDFVRILPGSFLMGSDLTDAAYRWNVRPATQVHLSQAFWMATTEVTQSFWMEVTGSNPTMELQRPELIGPRYPVVGVSWLECQSFCERLTYLSGRFVSLPTEAQWEYACRAGSQSAYFYGDDPAELERYSWYRAPLSMVALKEPNPWGLYDVYGSAAEWCLDERKSYPGGTLRDPWPTPSEQMAWGKDTAHVIRGGSSFYLNPKLLNSTLRAGQPADRKEDTNGLRIVVLDSAPMP